MKNEWFDNVFLKSIFERIGTNNVKWLTEKQTAVCTQYMKCETVRIKNAYDEYYVHDNYVYVWNGRNVRLSYSKKNGCGTIQFGLNAEEKAQVTQANVIRKKDTIREQAQRKFELHPEKYAERIKKMKLKIADYQNEIDECIKENDTDGLENLIEYVNEMKEELKIWESVI